MDHNINDLTNAYVPSEADLAAYRERITTEFADKETQKLRDYALTHDSAAALTDPVTGERVREAVLRYLSDFGLPMRDQREISALELMLARDAMMYREMKQEQGDICRKDK